MRITIDDLKQKGACDGGIRAFRRRYGKSVIVTKKEIRYLLKIEDRTYLNPYYLLRLTNTTKDIFWHMRVFGCKLEGQSIYPCSKEYKEKMDDYAAELLWGIVKVYDRIHKRRK